MSRIVYIAPRPGSNTGGNKIIFRHVEALQALGYDAVVRSPAPFEAPTWFHHTAAMEDTSRPIDDDDILVIAEDAQIVLTRCAVGITPDTLQIEPGQVQARVPGQEPP